MRRVTEMNLKRAAEIFSLAICILAGGGLVKAQAQQAKDPAPVRKNPLRLPAWAAKTDLNPLIKPFAEALDKGGKLTMQLPKALERELAVARNAGGRKAVMLRAGVAMAMPANAAARNQQMEQQIKAMIPQYRQQFINVMYGELQAVRNFCEVPKESRAEVYKVAEEAYDKALEGYVRNMYMPNGRGQNGGMLRSSVRASLVKSLEAKLAAEEFAKLSKGFQERAELRKRVAINVVVSRMDDALRLTQQQREKITESIRGAWDDNWESWMMLWQYEENYMPQIDDSLVSTHLTPQQRRIWQQTQKISLNGEMHSEFAGEFDSAFWGVKPGAGNRDGQVIEMLIER